MRSMFFLVPALVALFACGGHSSTCNEARAPGSSAPSHAGAAAGARWHGVARAIEIRTIRGRVRAHSADGDAIDVVARGSHGADPEMFVVTRGDTVIICVGAPCDGESRDARVRAQSSNDDDDDADERHGEDDRDDDARDEDREHARRRAIARAKSRHVSAFDVDVRIPRGVRFRATTVSGGIDAGELDAEVEANTVSGPIRISVAAAARASTVNGPIRATINARRAAGAIALSTVNGPIDVRFEDGAGAHVTAQTIHGRIKSRVGHDDDRDARSLETSVGDGKGEVHLSTVNGRVKIH